MINSQDIKNGAFCSHPPVINPSSFKSWYNRPSDSYYTL